MVDLVFRLNGEPMSTLQCGALRVAAFSGRGSLANRRHSVCVRNGGAIPPGAYYVFNRQSGGLLGPLRDAFSGHSNWFALYAVDDKINDELICDQVRRGAFRLHPKGATGVSYGCVVVDNPTDYQRVQAMVRAHTPQAVPGSSLKAYGRLIVS